MDNEIIDMTLEVLGAFTNLTLEMSSSEPDMDYCAAQVRAIETLHHYGQARGNTKGLVDVEVYGKRFVLDFRFSVVESDDDE